MTGCFFLLSYENRVFPDPNLCVFASHLPFDFNLGFATISAGDDGGLPLSHGAICAGACRTARTAIRSSSVLIAFVPGHQLAGWLNSHQKWRGFSIAMFNYRDYRRVHQDWTSRAEDRALEAVIQ